MSPSTANVPTTATTNSTPTARTTAMTTAACTPTSHRAAQVPTPDLSCPAQKQEAGAVGVFVAAPSPTATGEPSAGVCEERLPSSAIRALALRPTVIEAWRRNDPAGLPPMATWNLAGLRREKQGRGGATSLVTTVRGIIRCPLLYRVADLFPRQRTGRPSPPAAYWLFFGQVARELRSAEAADQELLELWEHVVVPEFAAQGVDLPDANRGTTNPIPGYHGYNRWRQKHLVEGGLIVQAIDANRDAMLELGALIAVAEGHLSDDPLFPSLPQTLTGDASVFQTASEVREMQTTVNGQTLNCYPGSRAVKGAARPDIAGAKHGGKTHGATEGLLHVALCMKGYDTYTRLVLDVFVAEPRQAETGAATPRIDRVLSAAPRGYFEAFAYDGAMYPKHYLTPLRRHGVYLVNPNSIAENKGAPEDTELAGYTTRQHGPYKGKTVRTHHTSLPSQRHQRPDGTVCVHHLVSDDGAVYPADRAANAGTPRKTGKIIPPTRLRRTDTGTGFRVHLDYVIDCPHGPLTYTVEITDTAPTNTGSVSWSSKLAAHRVIPEAWAERYRPVYGARNQTESFFSWLEQRYYVKDRAASWGLEGQLVDLLLCAMLQNSEAWAHYAVRHTN